MNDTAWFSKINATGGAIFFASGVFYYFLTEQVKVCLLYTSHRHGLAPIGRAVAGGAIVNALSYERFFAGNTQGTRRRAGGDDHRAALKDALAGVQRLSLIHI